MIDYLSRVIKYFCQFHDPHQNHKNTASILNICIIFISTHIIWIQKKTIIKIAKIHIFTNYHILRIPTYFFYTS